MEAKDTVMKYEAVIAIDEAVEKQYKKERDIEE